MLESKVGAFGCVPAPERPPQEGLPLVPRGWWPRQNLRCVPFSCFTIQGQVEAFYFCLVVPSVQRRDVVLARDPVLNRFIRRPLEYWRSDERPSWCWGHLPSVTCRIRLASEDSCWLHNWNLASRANSLSKSSSSRVSRKQLSDGLRHNGFLIPGDLVLVRRRRRSDRFLLEVQTTVDFSADGLIAVDRYLTPPPLL